MNDSQNSQPGQAAVTTPASHIVAVWAVALIPLAWGFINTLMRAAKLFQ